MDGFVCTHLLFLITLASIVYSQTFEDSNNLISNLTSNYNKQVRPVSNQQDTVYVNVSCDLLNIQSFDDVEGKLTFIGGLYMFWTDIRMQWNESLYNGSRTVYLLSSDVWVPELILLTPVNHVEKMPQDWTSVRFYSSGLAITGSAYVFHISCSVNIKFYPFDRQTCFLGIIPNKYFSTELMLRSISTKPGTSFYVQNGEWDLINTQAFTVVSQGASVFQVRLVLQRRPLFVVLIVILPVMVLGLLNILAFLMPPEERSGFTVTMLLAMAVFLTIISDNIPKTSSPLAIVCYFIGLQVLFSALICCGTILNLRIFHKDSSEPIPSWILYLTFVRGSCTSSTAPLIVTPNRAELTPSGAQARGDVNSSSSDGVSKEYGSVGKDSIGEPISWQQISVRLDYIFILVSLICFVINWAVFFLCVTFKDDSENPESFWS